MVEFGFVLPEGVDWLPELDDMLAGLAPHFTSLWMTDHFFWGDLPTYEAATVLPYLATKYPSYDIGSAVFGQNYRNPALLAKIGATLQQLSGGRFIMGVGAGWKEDEYHAFNYPYPSPGVRVAQLEDTLEIITRLWTEAGPVSYEGTHYRIQDAYCEPKPDPTLPILVGGGGKKTMMLAARFADIWNIPDAPLAAYKEKLAILDQHCETIGRDPATIRRTWFGRLAVASNDAAAVALSDGEWTSERAIVGTPARVIEQIEAYKAVGVDYFMFMVQGADDPTIRALITDEVMPYVR